MTFVAASGDSGIVTYPAASPNVIAVGGTTLTVSGDTRQGETPWVGGSGAPLAGYGTSANSANVLPTYQYTAGLYESQTRWTPDVAMDAGGLVDIYNSFGGGWGTTGATSLAVQLFAGLVAVIDQGRTMAGLPLFDTATLHTALYDAMYDQPVGDVPFWSVYFGQAPAFQEYTGLGPPKDNTFVEQLAGVSFATGEPSSDYNNDLAISNLVAQGDFGDGITDPNDTTKLLDLSNYRVWNSPEGSPVPSVIAGSSEAWGTNSVQLYAAAIPEGGQISETITDLQPNTTYILTGLAWVDSGVIGQIEVDSYAGSAPALRISITAMVYSPATLYSVVFTTGSALSNSDPPKITLSSVSGSGSAYFENINLQQLSQESNFDFEAGPLDVWTAPPAAPTAGPLNVWTYTGGAPSAWTTATGTTALDLPGTSNISQTIDGLQQDTWYTMAVAETGDDALVTVAPPDDLGDPLGSASFVPSANYNVGLFRFYTGDDTSVVLTLANTGSADDFFEGLNLWQSSQNYVIDVPAGENYTYSSAISGSVGLVKLGAGTLTLTGANDYTGGTTVAEGTLEAAAPGALPEYGMAGGAASGGVSVESGAMLALDVGGSGWDDTTVSDLATDGFAAGSALGLDTTNAGSPFTYGGNISGDEGLAKLGSGTLILSGTNAYLGTTTVSAGMLLLDAGGALPDGTDLVVNGGTLDLNGFNEQVGSLSGGGVSGSVITNSGGAAVLTVSTGGASDPTVSGIFGGIIEDGSGQVALTIAGTGTQGLAGVNNYTGDTVVSGGTTSLGVADAISDGAITVTGGTLSLDAAGAVSGVGITVSGGALTESVDDAISGTASLTVDGAGVSVTLSNANNYSGGTTVSDGTLYAATPEALPHGTAGEVTLDGGMLVVYVGGTVGWAAGDLDVLLENGTFDGGILGIDTTGAGGSFAYTIPTSGGEGVTKLGSGTLALTIVGGTDIGGLIAAQGDLALIVGDNSTSTIANVGGITVDAGAAMTVALDSPVGGQGYRHSFQRDDAADHAEHRIEQQPPAADRRHWQRYRLRGGGYHQQRFHRTGRIDDRGRAKLAEHELRRR